MSLEDIKARAERASVAPWHRDSSSEQDGTFLTENVVSCMWDVATCAGGSTHPDRGREQQAKADAEFIAHARTDIPKLVAALEAVLAIHVPIQAADGGEDEGCRACDWEQEAEYLCSTIRALTKALGD